MPVMHKVFYSADSLVSKTKLNRSTHKAAPPLILGNDPTLDATTGTHMPSLPKQENQNPHNTIGRITAQIHYQRKILPSNYKWKFFYRFLC